MSTYLKNVSFLFSFLVITNGSVLLASTTSINALLLNAVRSHDTESLKIMLNEMAPEEDCGEYAQSALMAAAYHGHADLAEMLIKNGADVDRQKKFKTALNGSWNAWPEDIIWDNTQTEEENFCSGKTPLAIALLKEKPAVVQLLIDAKADICNEFKCCCPEYAAYSRTNKAMHTHSPLEIAVLHLDQQNFEALLASKKSLKEEHFGKALLAATSKRDVQKLRMLLNRKSDVVSGVDTAYPYWSDCYLRYVKTKDYACWPDRPELARNSERFMREVYNASYLIAIANKDIECVRALLEAGLAYAPSMLLEGLQDAIHNHDGDIVDLILSINFARDSNALNEALNSAIKTGNPCIVKKLLQVGARINGDSLYNAVALNNDAEVMRLIVEEGLKDSELRYYYDKLFNFVVIWACLNLDRTEGREVRRTIIKQLINNGVAIDCECIIHEKNGYYQIEKCYTPLTAAICARDAECVRMLIEMGAFINKKGSFIEAPLTVAVQAGSAGIVKLLLERGADPRYARLNAELYKTDAQILAFEEVLGELVSKKYQEDHSLDKRSALLVKLAIKHGLSYKEAQNRFAQ